MQCQDMIKGKFQPGIGKVDYILQATIAFYDVALLLKNKHVYILRERALGT